ncbi:MAG: hypothetical protein CSA34_02825 [Desulfobulbus propionicus]|nr:MAG: hypothetical protein CSA34_02825 [Desulfobulbus propionicus]
MSERGFTLLEILLAISLLGLVVAMISLALAGSVRVVEVTDAQGDAYFQARVVLQRISDDLSGAVLLQHAAFVGDDKTLSGQQADELSFTSHAHLVFDPEHQRPGVAQVRYTVKEGEEQPGVLQLFRSDTLLLPKVDDVELVPDVGFLLADKVRNVSFTYFSREGEELTSWDTSGTKRRLPAAVRIDLSLWMGEEEWLDFQTTVPVMTGLYAEPDNS